MSTPAWDPEPMDGVVERPLSGATERSRRVWRTEELRVAALDPRPTHRVGSLPQVRVQNIGDLEISDWDNPDFVGMRSRRLAEEAEEALLVVSIRAGRQIIEGRGGELVAGPGKLLLVTTREPGRVVVPDRLRKRVVRIPLHALATFDTGGAIPEILLLDTQQNALAGLARDYMAGMHRYVDQMSSSELDATRQTLLVLVAGMVRSSRGTSIDLSDALATLRRRMEAWIVDHLASGSIRVADLAAAHNVAVRTVHRAFASTGDTVGTVARAHRLAAARSDLVNTSLPITAIAHRWGFCDTSHLGRQFREAFSMSPGDYRESFATASRLEVPLGKGA